jgi:FAD/FMN-containing dehydrogenase
MSGYWLWLIVIPVLGPVTLFIILGLKRGMKKENKFGSSPNLASDYYKNPDADPIRHLKTGEKIVNDVSRLNPVLVSRAVVPNSIEEVQQIVRTATTHISVGGGRFSMGGHTASSYGIHIDMRSMNRVLSFSPEKRLIKAEAGIRWCDIQKHIDPFNLSIKVMQSYANFTIGGSVSVNCHGRYIGYGSVSMTVRSLDIVTADGSLLTVSRSEHSELFEAVVGCYNAVAVIVAVELDLAENELLERKWKLMRSHQYVDFFKKSIRANDKITFHNGDLYPPDFSRIRAVSWVKTKKKTTQKARLITLRSQYPLERFFISSFSKSNFSKWRRQFIVDPILYSRKKIHWRNYEAGYDVAELEPASREYSSYILQEYFVPIDGFGDFSAKMAEVFRRYNVNVINVSIRHAIQNRESLLSWSEEEVFAFVIWYKQSTHEKAKNTVGIWTRELTNAALSCGGTYYLPYQLHATEEQFHKAYPRAKELFRLKQRIDPNYKFRNSLWEKYYNPAISYD